MAVQYVQTGMGIVCRLPLSGSRKSPARIHQNSKELHPKRGPLPWQLPLQAPQDGGLAVRHSQFPKLLLCFAHQRATVGACSSLLPVASNAICGVSKVLKCVRAAAPVRHVARAAIYLEEKAWAASEAEHDEV